MVKALASKRVWRSMHGAVRTSRVRGRRALSIPRIFVHCDWRKSSAIAKRCGRHIETRRLCCCIASGRAKQAGPVRDYLSGAVTSASEPVSRILSCAVIPLDAALPRTFISDLPGGFGTCSNRLSRIGPIRLAARFLRPVASPSLFGLAPCGVYPARRLTAPAVRSYRTFSPLPQRDWPSRRTWGLSGGPGRLERDGRGSRGGIFSVALAVHAP